MTKYGFLGLGIMGFAMASNLVRAGHDVTVWNRSPGKAKALAAAGARVGQTPRAVVAGADITFAMLADPEAARVVCFGKDGVLAGTGPGHDYIDLSTVDDDTSRTIAAAVTATGARFLEAPVSGTRKPAEDGTLIFLAAGDRSLYDAAAPAFDRMGKKRVYLGDIGQGARMKLIVNMIMGAMMASLGEKLTLAGKSGLDAETLLDVLDAGAMACPMFKGKGAMIGKGDFSANFPLKHMQKDLRLAVLLGDELRQPLNVIAAANEDYKRAMAAGFADEDMCAVAKAVRS